ncbi:MAG: hypothetical protein KM312_12595 [Hydrogenibacillus schlegelii]|uniref:YgiT-type zinc finger protein n=1 Tax=Hydrogenibacillus schlegelii TaxID=1484 RepID=A0A947CZH1_HYDSH|nr:hypothetical protein [Hydrogenibacillus schlegelii]
MGLFDRCPRCGGPMVLKRRAVHYPPHLIRGVPVWTCPACGEVRLDARTKAALRPLLGRLQGETAGRVVTFPFSSGGAGRPEGGRAPDVRAPVERAARRTVRFRLTLRFPGRKRGFRRG